MSSRIVATRINQDAHSKLMAKCSSMRCTPYEYLKVLIETDMMEEPKVEPEEGRIEIVG